VAAYVVRVPYVVDLKAKRVLQVVAGLFAGESGHNGGSLCNVYDLEGAGFGQRAGNFVNLLRDRYPVCLAAAVELLCWADVASGSDRFCGTR
jgi:hypothetical protein